MMIDLTYNKKDDGKCSQPVKTLSESEDTPLFKSYNANTGMATPKTSNGKVVRLWHNSLLEYHPDGTVVFVRSYTVPAKESDVKRITKPKKKAVKKAKVKKIVTQQKEDY